MIYIAICEREKICKIGYSRDVVSFKSRKSALNTGCPYNINKWGVLEGDMELEKALHNKFCYNRLNGEWFTIYEELNNFIIEYCGEMNSLNLIKGDSLNLSKTNPSLNKVTVALGWKANDGNGEEFDLDASCFMLKSNGKLVDGTNSVVFYGQKEIAAPAIIHSGDDRKGNDGLNDKDCESIKVDFSKLDPRCERLDFVITIFVDPKTKAGSDLTFGNVRNAFVRIVDDATGKEVCRYNLSNDFDYARAVLVCSISKRNAEWHFDAVGTGEPSADLNTYLSRYEQV